MERLEIELDGYATAKYEDQVDRDPYDPQYSIEGTAYAWGKTARTLTEVEMLQALDNTDGAFWAVDICSSYPYYRQMMIGRHRERSREASKRAVGAFADKALYVKASKNPVLQMRDFDPEMTRAFRDMVGPQKTRARELFHSAVFDIISDPPKFQNPEEEEQAVRARLLDNFYLSPYVEEVIMEPSGVRGDKGNWQYISHVDTGITLFQELNSRVGEDAVIKFLEGASEFIASNLSGKLKREIYVSIDKKDLSDLTLEAQDCFPERMLDTRFFESGEETSTHIKADMGHLPLKPGSIGFISSIEGWPFYGGQQSEDEKLDTAQQLADALKPGGKAVFFTWEVKREDLDTATNMDAQKAHLRAVEALWKKMGLIVEKQGCTHEELVRDMSDRELLLTDHSPIFTKGNGILTKVVLTKPK